MFSTCTRSALLGGLTGVAMLAAGSAIASPISFGGYADQTDDGQNFTFTFTDADLSAGPGTLSIHGHGDFNDMNETFSVKIDGNAIATNFHPATSGHGSDVDFSATFTITGAMMAAATADEKITILIDYSSNVEFWQQSEDPFVAMMLSYEPYTAPIHNPPPPPPSSHIAEPTTLALFGLGLAGLGFARRRKTA